MQITKDFYRDTDLRITVLRSTYLIAALYIEHTLGMSPSCEREREREREIINGETMIKCARRDIIGRIIL